MRRRHTARLLLTILVVAAAAVLAPTPSPAGIAFQTRQELDLGGEPLAASLAGADAQRVVVATTDGVTVFRHADGALERTGRAPGSGPVRVLAAGSSLVAWAERDGRRMAIAPLDARGGIGAPAGLPLPGAARAARIARLTPGGEEVVLVAHDAGVTILTRGDAGWRERDLDAPRFAVDLAVGDLDGDGHADVVLADDIAGTLHVLRGRGDGVFEAAPPVTTTRGTRRVVLADVTADGHLDVLGIGTGGILLHRGAADGRPGAGEPLWPSAQVTDLAVVDVTGDGRPDIIVADRSAGALVILAGRAGGFSASGAYLVGPAVETVLAGDLDADGLQDVLALGHLSRAAVWLRGRGDGSFAGVPCAISGFGPLAALASADFDGDGYPDLAGASEDTGSVGVFLGTGDGRFRALPPVTVGRQPRALAAGDFNFDERADLAVASFGSDTVVILQGDGRGGFAAPRPIRVGSGPNALAIGSFASPTSVDLAVLNSLSDSVSILYGDGEGQFPRIATHPAPKRPGFLIVGDTNEDGHQDLVVGSTLSESVAILLGTGEQLGEPTIEKLAGVARPSLAEDFDRDGHMDLVTAAEHGDSVEILPGIAGGTFSQPIQVPVGRDPQAVITADFDRDGRADVAVAHGPSRTIAILLNRSESRTRAAIDSRRRARQ